MNDRASNIPPAPGRPRSQAASRMGLGEGVTRPPQGPGLAPGGVQNAKLCLRSRQEPVRARLGLRGRTGPTYEALKGQAKDGLGAGSIEQGFSIAPERIETPAPEQHPGKDL